ncbi:hypothetical protein [Cupriavidus sp. L7L]|nr:hypothetical protein [Cupriavidus sp. L7L]
MAGYAKGLATGYCSGRNLQWLGEMPIEQSRGFREGELLETHQRNFACL